MNPASIYADLLAQVRAALDDRVATKVADATGLSSATIRAIRNGDQGNPSWKTLEKLSSYLNLAEPVHD